jgi:hypothetical protein
MLVMWKRWEVQLLMMRSIIAISNLVRYSLIHESLAQYASGVPHSIENRYIIAKNQAIGTRHILICVHVPIDSSFNADKFPNLEYRMITENNLSTQKSFIGITPIAIKCK